MKLKEAQLQTFLKKAHESPIKSILIYGTDRGQVLENMERIAKSVVSDMHDPFLSVNLNMESIKDDPSRLSDEAMAISFTGERKLITIKDGTDTLTKQLKELLDHNMIEAFIVITADNLTPKSTLRQLFEKENKIGVLACYNDEGTDLSQVIQKTLNEKKCTINKEALQYLINHLGQDRATTKSELEKLCLFAHGKEEIDLNDVLICIGDTSLYSMNDLAFYIAEGNHEQTQRILGKLYHEGIYAVSILRSITRHFKNLYLAQTAIQEGEHIENAVKRVKPPIFYKYVDRFKSLLKVWSLKKIEKAFEILLQTELKSKTTGMPVEIICSRALMNITQISKKN